MKIQVSARVHSAPVRAIRWKMGSRVCWFKLKTDSVHLINSYSCYYYCPLSSSDIMVLPLSTVMFFELTSNDILVHYYWRLK